MLGYFETYGPCLYETVNMLWIGLHHHIPDIVFSLSLCFWFFLSFFVSFYCVCVLFES